MDCLTPWFAGPMFAALVCLLVACAVDADAQDGGPLDGAWALDSAVCDGADTQTASVIQLEVSGRAGVLRNSLDECELELRIINDFGPEPDAVSWRNRDLTCLPPACYQGTCPPSDRAAHDATFFIDALQLVLDEPHTPPTETLCEAGHLITYWSAVE